MNEQKFESHIERTGEGALNDLIFSILKSVHHNKIIGNVREFCEAVNSLDITISSLYGDAEYENEKDELDKKFNIKNQDPMADKKKLQREYWDRLLIIITGLISRTPLVPIRFVEGVIIEDDVNGDIQQEDSGD